MKFSAEDFEQTPKPPVSTLAQQYEEMQKRGMEPYDTPGEPVAQKEKITPSGITPGALDGNTPGYGNKHEDDLIDPFINNDNNDDGLHLPNVIILVSDNVKLIRNNSVPMLQVQLEIIQNALSIDNDMC